MSLSLTIMSLDVDVIHQDTLVAVEAMLLKVVNPMLMCLAVDVESHSIDEEMTPMMIERFCLTMMFDGGTVLAIDVQDDPAVKDVVKSQQWSLDVADVELDWATNVLQTSKMSLSP